MKLKYIVALSIFTIVLAACGKEDIMRYSRNKQGIEFSGSSLSYSFKISSKDVDTISIPFRVVGYSENRVRYSQFDIVADSTFGTGVDYQIIDGIVHENKYGGVLRIKIENKQGADLKNMRIYLQIANSADFIAGLDDNKTFSLHLSNNLVRPISWKSFHERYMLGNYSTAYYQFIIENTGETEFPFPSAVPGYNGGVKWSNSFKDAYVDKLKLNLVARNKRVGSPLLHDDGIAAQKEVIIGRYYQN